MRRLQQPTHLRQPLGKIANISQHSGAAQKALHPGNHPVRRMRRRVDDAPRPGRRRRIPLPGIPERPDLCRYSVSFAKEDIVVGAAVKRRVKVDQVNAAARPLLPHPAKAVAVVQGLRGQINLHQIECAQNWARASVAGILPGLLGRVVISTVIPAFAGIQHCRQPFQAVLVPHRYVIPAFAGIQHCDLDGAAIMLPMAYVIPSKAGIQHCRGHQNGENVRRTAVNRNMTTRPRWFRCGSVSPAKAGVYLTQLDSDFRRNDEKIAPSKLETLPRAGAPLPPTPCDAPLPHPIVLDCPCRSAPIRPAPAKSSNLMPPTLLQNTYLYPLIP